MRKTLLAAAAVMILFPMLAASSVSASVPKIDVSHAQALCDASGTISFSPPLTSHVVPTKVKLSAKLTTCEATGAPSPVTLTKGALKAAFDAAALSCTQLFNTPPLLHGALAIAWTADRHTPLLQRKTGATSVSGFGQQVTNASLSRVHTQLTLVAQSPTGAFLGASGAGTNVRTRMIFQPSTQTIGNLCGGAGVKSLPIGLGDQTAG